MRFEDLKLPVWYGDFATVSTRTARAVYEQMRAHYEAKPEPEELFEHPNMPGKKFRRLKVGERPKESDLFTVFEIENAVTCLPNLPPVRENDRAQYYREVQHPAPEWRLPDPPPGQQWHRTDWTQDMLPEGYRPLLLGESVLSGDEHDASREGGGTAWVPCILTRSYTVDSKHARRRTRRPLPAPVEYVPLEPGDVPPGSAVRPIGEQGWRLVTRVEEDCFGTSAGTFDWCDLADRCEILRPGSKTWEPCKKIKP